MGNKLLSVICSAVFFAVGCASYQSEPVPIKPASSYTLQARPQYAGGQRQGPQAQQQLPPNARQAPQQGQPVPGQPPQPIQPPARVSTAGLTIGAEVLSNPERCKRYFGVDLNEAGVLPVLLVFTNNGQNVFNLQRNQVFAVDYDNNMWQALTAQEATERIAGSEAGRDLLKGAGKGALIGGAGGAALGAALGAVMGDAGKGAMIGGAAGGIGGGAYGAGHEKSKMEKVINRDVMSKALQDQQIYSGYTVSGFIFFPKRDFHRIELNLFNPSAQQSIKYVITPRAQF